MQISVKPSIIIRPSTDYWCGSLFLTSRQIFLLDYLFLSFYLLFYDFIADLADSLFRVSEPGFLLNDLWSLTALYRFHNPFNVGFWGFWRLLNQPRFNHFSIIQFNLVLRKAGRCLHIAISFPLIDLPIDPNRHILRHHPLLIIIIQHIGNNPNNLATIPPLNLLNPLHNNLIQYIISLNIITIARTLQCTNL